MYQHLIPFLPSNILLYQCAPVDPLISAGTSWVISAFGLLMNNAALNIHVQVSVRTYVFNSLGHMLRIEDSKFLVHNIFLIDL